MKKSYFLTIISILITLFITVQAGALTISGYIPVEYASEVTITLSGDASGVTVTDSSGYYEFTGLAEGGSYTITPSKDYTPPVVTITSPASGESVTGSVNISAEILTDYCGYAFEPSQLTFTSLDSDQENQDFQVILTSCCFMISQIDFYVDAVLENTQTSEEMCQGVFAWTWDTALFSNSGHTITVVATDENLGQGSAEISVTVDNGTGMALIGDVNLSGSVDIIDALVTAQYYVGMNPANFDAPLGDANVDNTVDIIDALLISQYYVGLLTELPEELAGGYGQISGTSEAALEAYDFLALELASTNPEITLNSVKLAFMQVVAGYNIRLVCSYYSSSTGSDHYLIGVVFFDVDMVPEQVNSLTLDVY